MTIGEQVRTPRPATTPLEHTAPREHAPPPHHARPNAAARGRGVESMLGSPFAHGRQAELYTHGTSEQ
jgi:hypothetical protein